ncbi:MAG: LysM peptidoglycan-binding domain-containing protein [Defluviitaleaceae bacterium]|nr:LysM peptidoglycan-binding domain-containing protein [Defluviitaleaceae bacterium]MCL2274760.1 LysM peptidoglycan-binding domain-containing protein [Defluviitaleaceae bacterium]
MKNRFYALLLVAVLAMGALAPFALNVQGEVVIVQEGDVLWRIAHNHGLTYQELADYNNLTNPHFIRVGQELHIPALGVGGGTVMLAGFPFIPDFLAISENIELLESGDAQYFGMMPDDLFYDRLLYAFSYATTIEAFWDGVEIGGYVQQFLDAVRGQGFVLQGVEELWFSTTYYYYNAAQDISLIISVDEEFGEMAIVILRTNIYTEIEALAEAWLEETSGAWDFEFDWDSWDFDRDDYWDGDWDGNRLWDWSVDPEVVGTWIFIETNDIGYAYLMTNGEVFYIFLEYGIGYWGAMDENGNITDLLSLFWETFEGVLYIDFPSIGLFLDYDYDIYDGNLYLFGALDDNHILTRTTREIDVRARFNPPVPWLRDPVVANRWRFEETNNWFYDWLMGYGYVIYQFNADGTGYWGGAAVNEGLIDDIPLYWWTQEDLLVISFPSIDLLLFYYFDENEEPYGLFLSNRFDGDVHLLVPVNPL